ncbi:MAG: carbohydrate binding domain-containing protein [Clostridia bacterium]|nr:carbohydrate binding domain-containing protein [Clostridia bacterium]
MKSRIKSIIAAILAFAMIATSYVVAFPASAATTEDNLIVNGGFENGLDGWLIYADSAISTDAHSGTGAVSISAADKYAKVLRQEGIALEANTDYVFTFWAKGAADSTGTKGFHAYVYDSTGKTKLGNVYFGITSAWGQYTIEFNSGEFTECYVNFTTPSAPDGGVAVIDDAVLLKVEEPDTAMIKNGGFEASSINPWLIYSETALTTEAHEGSKALRLFAPSGSSNYTKVARQENIALEANTDYVFTFWAKAASDNTGSKGYHAYVFGGSSGSNKLADNSFSPTSDWRQYTIEFNSGDYTSCFINFSTGSSPDGTAIVIDDLYMEAVAEVDDALIKNGGFETGNADPWVINSGSSIVTDAHEGSYALRALSTGSYGSAARQNNVVFEPNTDYVLSFWAKGDPNNPGSKGYHAYVVGGSDYHNQLKSNTITISNDWTLYTLEFNSGEYTFGYVNFSCGSSPDGGAILIDDVLLEVAPENTDGIIKNPGFENTSVDPWEIFGSSAITSDAHTGSKALILSGTSYYAKVARQMGLKIEPNTDYVYTFWAKAAENSTGAKSYHAYVFGGSSGQDNKFTDKAIDITNEWTLYTVRFNSGDFTECYIHFSAGSSPDGSAVVVDDFAMEVFADTTLIKNGNFEAATADPWTLYESTALTADAHAGSQALRLLATGSYGKAARQTGITIKPNTDYMLCFWAKGDPDAQGSKGYHVGVYDSGSTKIVSEYIGIPAEWTFYTISFNSGDVTSCYVNFSASSSPDGAALIIDDVVLEEKPDEILIRNGGFEENGYSPWTTGGTTALSDVAHEGDHSLRLMGSTYYQSVAKQTGLILTKNTEYILVFWAKWDSASGGTKQYHSYIFGDKEKICSNSIALTDEWRRYAIAFNSGDYADWYINFSAGSAPDGSAIYIDDVEIIHREGSGYYGEYPEQLVDGADIRIVSFNVLVAQEDFSWSPWVIGDRPNKFKAFIDYYKPDVVGLQECSEKWHEGIKQLLGDTYEFLNPDFGGQADMNCSPIIYDKTKVRVIASEVYSYTIGNSPRFRLIDIGVFERISDGRRFIVSSTHLDPGWEGSDGGDKTYERNVQAGELVRKAREYISQWNCPYISTGDMNCPAGDVPYNTIVNSGVLVDADAHPAPGVVDHIFHSVGTECLFTARVTDSDLQGTSDHYPLIADFKLTEMPALYTPGDIDGDDEITVGDALIALRVSVGLADAPEGNTFSAADVDGDGEITVSDALHILRKAAGLE